MALSALAPAVAKSRKAVVDRSARAVLRLVPDLKPTPGEQASDRLFYGLIGFILSLGLLGLLGINILLGNDAFRIKELKLEAIAINEEREAALREVARIATPENLAARATTLGMVPSTTPRFLDLTQTVEAKVKP
ncbi:MAG: hypothetical protein FJW47_01505 [Actinobacteria bacterium]|nr:hypothetical protein [Actinomycetota bacterium]